MFPDHECEGGCGSTEEHGDPPLPGIRRGARERARLRGPQSLNSER